MAKAGRDGASSKGTGAKAEHQNGTALEMQSKARTVTAMGFKGLLPRPQDTPLLLWAMGQHKQKSQAKHSGHEALFRPSLKPRIQMCSRYKAVKKHKSLPPLPPPPHHCPQRNAGPSRILWSPSHTLRHPQPHHSPLPCLCTHFLLPAVVALSFRPLAAGSILYIPFHLQILSAENQSSDVCYF